MNNYIDTREGWKELDVVEPNSTYQLAEYDPRDGSVVRAWVREEPVPPLPTNPYTVIRVTWQGGETGEAYFYGNKWRYADGSGFVDLLDVADFEVLSEPRAVTAKAVIDRVHELTDSVTAHLHIEAIAREFGVDS